MQSWKHDNEYDDVYHEQNTFFFNKTAAVHTDPVKMYFYVIGRL